MWASCHALVNWRRAKELLSQTPPAVATNTAGTRAKTVRSRALPPQATHGGALKQKDDTGLKRCQVIGLSLTTASDVEGNKKCSVREWKRRLKNRLRLFIFIFLQVDRCGLGTCWPSRRLKHSGQVRHSHYFAVTHQDRKTTAIHTLANAHWQSNLQFIGGSLTFPNLHLVCIFELECWNAQCLASASCAPASFANPTLLPITNRSSGEFFYLWWSCFQFCWCSCILWMANVSREVF